MQSVNLRFIDVTFSYNESSENIVSSLNLHFSRGWTGIVGPNGAGKTTIAKLAAGILTPKSGIITGLKGFTSAIYCAQETDYPPDKAIEFLYSDDSSAGEPRSILGIGNDWIDRWVSLSYGERKRFQAGMALWEQSDILILDEPVNHLDLKARRMLTIALKTYKGIGIIVSHDRELLDTLCSFCLFMRPGVAVMRAGNFSAGLEQEELEEKSREKEYIDALKRYRRTRKSAFNLKQRESARSGSLSKKNIAKHDHDNKRRIDVARLTGKDKWGARKVTLMEKRAELIKMDAESKYFKRRPVRGIIFQGQRLTRDSIVTIPKGNILLGPYRRLEYPELIVHPSDRIAVTGENGAGKSTLLKQVYSLLPISRDRVIYIPQEIEEEDWEKVHNEMKNLDRAQLGELLTAVHRLDSEPERILFSALPSPGEKRKIMLGIGLLRIPVLIMMDEPTNHMDMPSIRCLENALNQFTGAIIMVSHDIRFMKNITHISWNLVRKNDNSRLIVRM